MDSHTLSILSKMNFKGAISGFLTISASNKIMADNDKKPEPHVEYLNSIRTAPEITLEDLQWQVDTIHKACRESFKRIEEYINSKRNFGSETLTITSEDDISTVKRE